VTTQEIFGPGFAGLSEKEKIRRTATELEAVVLAQILSSLRKTVPDGGLFESSLSHDVFRSMLDAELARATAERSPFGLADAMVESFENRFKPEEEEAERADELPSISSARGFRRSWRV
jgi:flagellar protein FlgJ